MDAIEHAVEELTEEARISGAHPDEPTNYYRKAHAALLAAIRSYGAQCAAEAREEDAAYLEARARTMDQGEPGSPARWMARIFRDEAAAIRALS